MPGQKSIKADSWRWFRAELERRLGKAEADALWDELAERRKRERIANEQQRAPRMIAELEHLIAYRRGRGESVARLHKQLARWRALLDNS